MHEAGRKPIAESMAWKNSSFNELLKFSVATSTVLAKRGCAGKSVAIAHQLHTFVRRSDVPEPFPFTGIGIAHLALAENRSDEAQVVFAVGRPDSRHADAEQRSAGFNPRQQFVSHHFRQIRSVREDVIDFVFT